VDRRPGVGRSFHEDEPSVVPRARVRNPSVTSTSSSGSHREGSTPDSRDAFETFNRASGISRTPASAVRAPRGFVPRSRVPSDHVLLKEQVVDDG
jgi:hypothetical protein